MAARPQKPELQALNSAAACPVCQSKFIVFTRPKNCQGCGKVFCKACCNYWIYLPSDWGFTTAQNVCKECFVGVSELDHSVKFDVAGPEDGLPVILLHPSAVTRRFWAPYMEFLSQEGYRVYAIDFPGHGSRMEERLTVSSAHSAINEVYNQHIAPKKCVVWGHELGGYLALSYGGVHPDSCVGIIASNACAGRDAKTSELKMAAQSLLYSVKWNSTLAERPNELLNTNSISKDYIYQNLLRCGTYYQAWDGVLESVNVKNYLELIRSFPGKIFFLNGSLTDRSAEERFLGAAQEATMEVLNNANDWFIIDDKQTDLVKDLVGKFLAKLKEKDQEPSREINPEADQSPDNIFIHKNNFSRDEQPIEEESLPEVVLDKSSQHIPVDEPAPAPQPIVVAEPPHSEPEPVKEPEPEPVREIEAAEVILDKFPQHVPDETPREPEPEPEPAPQPVVAEAPHSEPEPAPQPVVVEAPHSEPEPALQHVPDETPREPEPEPEPEPAPQPVVAEPPHSEPEPVAEPEPEVAPEPVVEAAVEPEVVQVESESKDESAVHEFDEVSLLDAPGDSLEDELAQSQ